MALTRRQKRKLHIAVGYFSFNFGERLNYYSEIISIVLISMQIFCPALLYNTHLFYLLFPLAALVSGINFIYKLQKFYRDPNISTNKKIFVSSLFSIPIGLIIAGIIATTILGAGPVFVFILTAMPYLITVIAAYQALKAIVQLGKNCYTFLTYHGHDIDKQVTLLHLAGSSAFVGLAIAALAITIAAQFIPGAQVVGGVSMLIVTILTITLFSVAHFYQKYREHHQVPAFKQARLDDVEHIPRLKNWRSNKATLELDVEMELIDKSDAKLLANSMSNVTNPLKLLSLSNQEESTLDLDTTLAALLT